MEKQRKDTTENKLGKTAYDIMLDSVSEKELEYGGVPRSDLPHDHLYEIVNINYGPNTLMIEDKTDKILVLGIPLDLLPHFYEILREE